jgi:hypothetical protein
MNRSQTPPTGRAPRALVYLAALSSVLSLSACVITPLGPPHARVHVDAVATVPVHPAPAVVVRPGWRGHYRHHGYRPYHH